MAVHAVARLTDDVGIANWARLQTAVFRLVSFSKFEACKAFYNAKYKTDELLVRASPSSYAAGIFLNRIDVPLPLD